MTAAASANPFYEGCTPVELSRLFRVSTSKVRDILRDTPPYGTRGGRDVWLVHEVAMGLLRDNESEPETVERILKLHHTKMPKMLSKEFWFAQTYKQKYDITAGNLWRTEEVIEMAGDAFKTIRLSLQLMSDTVERNEVLTEKQRRTILDLVDSVLLDMREKLIDAFENRRVSALDEKASSGQDDGHAEL